jgi:hypothetical protein
MRLGSTSSSQIAPTGYFNAVGEKFCAYNRTRKRFLSANVEAADFSPTVLQGRVPLLAESADLALWYLPFRGISPTLISEPIDLVYLDPECVVLETIESFPVSQASASGHPASSVLVLKAGSIESSKTQAGDQLVFCGAEEMKRRLKRAAKELSHQSVEKLAELSSLFSAVDVSKGIPTHSKPFIVDPATVPPAPTRAPAFESNPAALQRANLSRGWLERLLFPEPADPRTARRVAVEWLVAYFFTGGNPEPHKVRDVGQSGIYIYTEERWSPGSIIRLTLTDAREPSPERSITLNARVVRWGNDGVGFKFVLQNSKPAKRNQNSMEDLVAGVAREAVAQFLYRIRANSI